MARLVILGSGESGVGTALLGKKEGYEVFVSDFGKIDTAYKEVLIKNEIKWEEHQHTEDEILNADLVMKSPGIPETAAIVRKLREKNIAVISEIEFASRFSKAYTIGITGSNGKTTTTLLTHHILKAAGLNVGMAGNIGQSYAKQIAEEQYDGYVLELSSFQLDGIKQYKPHIAIITNLSPDHLDRYEYKYQKYIDSKFRITMNQDENDYLIYDADDIEIQKWLQNNKTKAKTIGFSLTKKIEPGAYLTQDTMMINIDNDEMTIPVNTMALEGKHNLKNAMAAATVAKILQVRKNTIRESMSDFQGVEHRLERVIKLQNVLYINDSKATNVNSVMYALDSVSAPIVWIAGGVDKGNNYSELMSLVREKVKAIVCLGIDNSAIIDSFKNVVDILIESESMDEAVKIASRIAEQGDTVLLSPACASYDLFKNYEDRGLQFKKAVKSL
ncbi:MAG TPA: UDP-N-acetylmuramoyl-L-alanine--D-glutamate ligase [Flavobacterium sp.]|nr:UDP-N-acetylmuramoyl-L-alanine--D-glutamate ligase [Flavobacterium sp.]